MSAPSRILPRLRPFAARVAAPRFASTHTIQSQTPPTPLEASKTQALPIGAFYQAMVDSPIPHAKVDEPPVTAATHPSKKQPAAKKTPTEPQEEPPAPSPPPAQTAEEKAAIIFGSALAGPQSREARLAAARKKSTLIAGVLVPPKPEEPDNCCMSGCVNCVWDRFRDDMEEWSAANSEAQMRLREQEASAGGDEHAGVSMDDDGGGSETNWVPKSPPKKKSAAKNLWDDELYANIPVGIREFMKTEKKLKEWHEEQGTSRG